MKLFERFSIKEGEMMPSDVFLSFGTVYSPHGQLKVRVIKLELPFSVMRKVYDPNSFYRVLGKCRMVMAVRFRKGHMPMFVKVWKLIDPSTATILQEV